MSLRIKKLTIFSAALRTVAVAGFLALALSSTAVSARADLVTNGGFETNTGSGQLGFNTSATDWATSGYNFLFAPGTGDTSGANGQYGGLSLWGPNNGSANGLPATSPDGGYYVAADADFQVGAITQAINGLTPGEEYTVGFWWGAAQQLGYTGTTTQQWQVTLGSETQSTSVFTNPSEAFSGWMYQTFNYTATSTSEVLSFLAVGSPQIPPFTLLDGVSLNPTTSAVPEPGSVALMLGILGLMAGVLVFRSKKLAKI